MAYLIHHFNDGDEMYQIFHKKTNKKGISYNLKLTTTSVDASDLHHPYRFIESYRFITSRCEAVISNIFIASIEL